MEQRRFATTGSRSRQRTWTIIGEQIDVHLDAKIFVAGHRGLWARRLSGRCGRMVFKTSFCERKSELDLTNQNQTGEFFAAEKALVCLSGGGESGRYSGQQRVPGDFVAQNLQIQTNIIESARKSTETACSFSGRVVFIPSSPPQPISEESLLTALSSPPIGLTRSQKSPASKCAGPTIGNTAPAFLPRCQPIFTGPVTIMTCDLSRHSRTHPQDARSEDKQCSVATLWGTGSPRREFLYSDDLADACLFLMNLEQRRFDSLVASDHTPPWSTSVVATTTPSASWQFKSPNQWFQGRIDVRYHQARRYPSETSRCLPPHISWMGTENDNEPRPQTGLSGIPDGL